MRVLKRMAFPDNAVLAHLSCHHDPNLVRSEALTGAQKQLLRMGPDNVKAIQQQLRLFALALGIPAQRLPA